jgi:hypothetical protein
MNARAGITIIGRLIPCPSFRPAPELALFCRGRWHSRCIISHCLQGICLSWGSERNWLCLFAATPLLAAGRSRLALFVHGDTLPRSRAFQIGFVRTTDSVPQASARPVLLGIGFVWRRFPPSRVASSKASGPWRWSFRPPGGKLALFVQCPPSPAPRGIAANWLCLHEWPPRSPWGHGEEGRGISAGPMTRIRASPCHASS